MESACQGFSSHAEKPINAKQKEKYFFSTCESLVLLLWWFEGPRLVVSGG